MTYIHIMNEKRKFANFLCKFPLQISSANFLCKFPLQISSSLSSLLLLKITIRFRSRNRNRLYVWTSVFMLYKYFTVDRCTLPLIKLLDIARKGQQNRIQKAYLCVCVCIYTHIHTLTHKRKYIRT